MSDSAQKIPASSSPEDGQSKWPWVILSVGFHALVLGWLIFLVPVEDITAFLDTGSAAQAPAAESASADLVRQVSMQIEATQSDELRSRLEELQATEKLLTDVQEQQSVEFAALSQELAAEAPALAADAQTAADEAQARAEQAQAEALRLAGELKTLTEPPASKISPVGAQPPESLADETKARVAAAQENAKTAQAAATAAQTSASQQLAFREDATFKKAKAAQDEALTAQEEANRKQDEATGKIGAMSAQQRAAQQAATAAQQSKSQANALESRKLQIEQSIAKQTDAIGQQKARIDALKQKPDTAKGGTAKEIEKLGGAISSALTKVENTKTELRKAEAKIAELQAKSSKDAEEAAKLDNLANAAPAQALVAQEAALKAQQKARELQSRAKSAVANVSPTEGPPVTADRTAEAPAALDGKSFAGLYDTAIQTEKQIAEQFQSIRATQVAVQRKIPISEAKKFVKIVTPERAEYSGVREGAPDDAAALEKQNAAMEEALQQVDSMVALSRSMAFQAANSGKGTHGLTVSAATMQAQANQADQLAGLATEGEGGNAADLTGLMKEIERGTGEHGAGPHGQTSGNGSGQGNGPAGPAGFGRGEPGGGVPAMGAVSESIPGRKVHAGGFGGGTKWMFVDTWYMIGPFPNPQRRNIDTKFPPESIIDLDATYPVEGQNLRWQFVQTAAAGIRPPLSRQYAIYYGYTTLWFDEHQDMWIATGSDDFSKLWINDMLVWASGSVQKVWKPNEGYRRVHFKKGLNRVLFRLENGHNDCMFSLMLNMQAAS